MESHKKTKIIIILIIFLLIISAGLIIKKTIYDKPKNELKIMPDYVDLQIQDFIYTEVSENNAKWEIKAEIAKYIKKDNIALFEKVQIKLRTAEGKIVRMTGDKGKMLTDKKDIQITGNVVIVSDEGDRFSTDYLNYSDAEKKFYTDAPVILENKRMKIKGTGLKLFMNTGELKISSLVKAKIQ